MKIDWKPVSDGKPKHTDGALLFATKMQSFPYAIATWEDGIKQTFGSPERPFWTHYVPLLDILATLAEPDPKNILLDISERLERLEKFLVI